MLLKDCRFVVTQNEQREVLEHVDVLIEGSRIVRIGQGLSGSPIIDCSRRLVLPGLINAHTHLGMHTLRGISDDKELAPWLADVWAAEAELTDGRIEEGCYLGIAEALRSGTTAIGDMYFREELAGKAAQELGVRFVGAQAFLDHPLSPKEVSLPDDMSERVRFCYGPHSIYATDEKTLREIARRKAFLQIHISETRKERAEFRAKHGKLPVEYLKEIGLLGPRTLLVHAVWLTKGELDLMAKAGAKVVHCPQSNMKLAGGSVMPVREMMERGIVVALGTDSVASNNAMDMFREMHTAALLHKHHYWSGSATSAQQVLDMATLGGAHALGIDAGSIEERKLADIVTLDLDDLNLRPVAKERVVSHIVYAASGLNVAEVIVDGKLLLKEKVFV